MLQNKGCAHISTVSWGTWGASLAICTPTDLLIFVSWQYVEYNASQLVTLVQ